MLEDTLVIWGGEFGRTPTVELPQPRFQTPAKINGRDHNHYGFTTWLAGGGVKGGYVHGATDEFGFQAIENKVHIHDLHATILWLMVSTTKNSPTATPAATSASPTSTAPSSATACMISALLTLILPVRV